MLSFSPALASQSGTYQVIITNALGAVTSAPVVVEVGYILLTVNGQPGVGTNLTTAPASVVISGGFSNGFLFYTTDGSTPTEGSTLYSGPFNVTNSGVVNVLAVSEDFSQTMYGSPLTVQIIPNYPVMTSVTGGGSIALNPPTGPYLSNSVVTLTATPATYWAFAYWTNGASGNQNPLSIAVDRPLNVQAVFVQTAFLFMVSTAGGGTVSVSGTGSGTVGSIPNLFATGVSSSGVSLSGGSMDPHWKLSGSTNGVPVVLSTNHMYSGWTPDTATSSWIGVTDSVQEPTSFPYYFNLTFTLAGFNPTTAVLAGTWWGDDNTSIELNGHVISSSPNNLTGTGWSVNDTGAESGWFNAGTNILSVEMNTADGSLDGARVEVTGTANGFLTTGYYQINTMLNLTATPSNGWSFVGWQGNATGTNNPLAVVVTQTNNIQAVFGTTVQTNVSGGGTIVLTSPNPVPYGTTLTASAVPNPGNFFVTWAGAASGTNAPTTIQVTNGNPTIDALFATLPAGKYSLAVVVVGNGSVAISPQKNYYNPGDVVTLTASTTNFGTTFYGWSGNTSESNNIVTGSNSTLTVVISNSTVIQANFEAFPTVSVSPSSVIVYAGSNAVLTANAAGIPPFTYQWQDSQGAITGQTNSTFTLQDAQATNTDMYSVIVSNSYGSVTSSLVPVTVVFPPSITMEPVAQTVAAGTSATLNVTASGTAPLAYQWQNSSGSIPGATNAAYTLNPATTNNWDNYSVVVSNLYGVATSSVVALIVYAPIIITNEPQSQIVSAGSNATFIVTASGYPAPAYQWSFNGMALPGATSSTLTISNVDLPNLGSYAVLITNGYSSLASTMAILSMAPSIVTPFTGATVVWGQNATLSVGAIGSGNLSYQWFQNGMAIPGASMATLTLPSIQFTNGGLYSVVVTSSLGSVTNTPALLVVNPAGVSVALYPGVTINGTVGYSYIIQRTGNLSDTNSWVSVAGLTLTNSTELWVDTNTDASLPANMQQFYQVLPGQ